MHSGSAGRTAWMVVALVATCGALVLAGYLSVQGLLLKGTPPGCGAGSGCADVLHSRWSSLLGVPVSVPAAGLYAALLILLMRARVRGTGRAALALLSGAILGGVAWFVVLQVAVLRTFCVYCMTDHALGAIAAGATLGWLMRTGHRPAHGVALGALAAGAMAVLQVVQPTSVFRVDLPTGRDYDVVRDDARHVGLLDGTFAFRIPSEPVVGHADAAHLLFLMVDYACPHCRKLHELARELQATRPEHVALVILPTPIHPDCNPAMEQVPDRFAHSCELARLSLAVFGAAPDRWADYDRWLFDPETPRTPDEARAYAEAMLGTPVGAGLPAALDAMLERNIALFGMIPAEHASERRVPVTWAPGRAPIVGPVDRADVLLDLLTASPALSGVGGDPGVHPAAEGTP